MIVESLNWIKGILVLPSNTLDYLLLLCLIVFAIFLLLLTKYILHIIHLLSSEPDDSIENAVLKFKAECLDVINQELKINQTTLSNISDLNETLSNISNFQAPELATKIEKIRVNVEMQSRMLNNYHLKMIQMNTKTVEDSDTRKKELKEWLMKIGKNSRTIKSYLDQIAKIGKEENENGNYINIWSADISTIETLELSYSSLSLYLDFLRESQK